MSKEIKNFDIRQLQPQNILFCVTSFPDFEMQRVIIAEDHDNYDSYLHISGGHCSCYGFDECQWSAVSYTREELEKVVQGWVKSSYSSGEQKMAELLAGYFSWKMEKNNNG